MTFAEVATLAMVPLGAAVALGGSWVLWKKRLGPRGAACSEPTRLSLGVVGLLLGYQLVVWGLAPFVTTPVAIPVEYWGWVVGIALVWVTGSLWLEAVDRRRG
ncbi:MAG: hypothetical protein KF745_14200 [Phycisphaeraceae bacterium]|nr:hypothetical protein [Phycisphaeraceae bacterium]